MKCPNCKTELAAGFSRTTCPACGSELEAWPTSPAGMPVAVPERRMNWTLFFTSFFGPLLLTILAVPFAPRHGDLAAMVAFFGGGCSALICGILLGRRIGVRPETRLWLSLLFILVMAVVCVGMNCFGCLAAGYKVNFH